MSRRSTDELIAELSHELAPVQSIPRPGVAGFAVGVLWLAAVWIEHMLGGPPADLGHVRFLGGPFVWAPVALAALAAAGLLAAFVSAIPGRVLVGRRAALGLLATTAAAAGVGVWAVLASGPASATASLPGDLQCVKRALRLAALPALAAVAYLYYGAPSRPRLSAGAALIGTIALGAIVVHLSCAEQNPWHLLRAHALAPVFGAALLALPVGWLAGRWASR